MIISTHSGTVNMKMFAKSYKKSEDEKDYSGVRLQTLTKFEESSAILKLKIFFR